MHFNFNQTPKEKNKIDLIEVCLLRFSSAIAPLGVSNKRSNSGGEEVFCTFWDNDEPVVFSS